MLQPVLESAPPVLVGPFGDNISAIFKDAVRSRQPVPPMSKAFSD